MDAQEPIRTPERPRPVSPPVPDEPSAIAQAAPIGLAVIAAPGRLTWANPAYFELTGRAPEMLGTDVHDILEEDGTWSRPIRDAVDTALATGAPAQFRAVPARYRTATGGVYLDVDVRPLPRTTASPARALLMIRDVSERVRDAEQIRLFYEAFRTSTNAMQLTDARGIMIDVNPAYEKIYGFSRAECIGRRPNLVRSRHTPPEVYERMWIDLLDPKRGYWSGELLNRDRKGRERPVLLAISAIRGPTGGITHYLGVAVDLSEQRSWELRAAHADKLASVGQLAAGVAHEINTPLANLMLLAESIRRKTQDPATLARLDTMTQQVEVAARIVRGLLDFSRREEPRTSEIDLVAVARNAVAFLRGKQSADVDLVEEYPAEPVVVIGDRGQMMQVLTNLLNNAYDAMEGHGEIRLSIRRAGARAEIEVLDHGPGISAEALPHIFEPFFTTKPEGQGTGLGLAICHGIIQSHYGAISARNVPGAGAAFLISLPIPLAARPPADARRPPDASTADEGPAGEGG